jgi:hypothetical protein
VSSCSYIRVPILLHTRPFNVLYALLCYYICVPLLTTVYASSYHYICVLLLLCMRPFTTVGRQRIHSSKRICVLLLLCMRCSITYLLLCMRLHTTIYASSYYCVFVFIPLHTRPHTTGTCFCKGIGVEANYTKALEW